MHAHYCTGEKPAAAYPSWCRAKDKNLQTLNLRGRILPFVTLKNKAKRLVLTLFTSNQHLLGRDAAVVEHFAYGD